MNHTKTGDKPDVNFGGSLQTPDLLPLRPQLALESLVLGEGLDSERLSWARPPCWALSAEGAGGTLPGKGPLPGQPHFILLFLASGAPGVSRWSGGCPVVLCPSPTLRVHGPLASSQPSRVWGPPPCGPQPQVIPRGPRAPGLTCTAQQPPPCTLMSPG